MSPFFKSIGGQITKIRRFREQTFNQLYTKEGELGDPCVYCGVYSDMWDHVPPLHYADRLTFEERRVVKFRKYPACSECNSMLSGLVLTKMPERKAYVKSKLRKKYHHLLNMPEWEDSEIEKLSGKLQEDVRRHVKHSRYIKARLRH